MNNNSGFLPSRGHPAESPDFSSPEEHQNLFLFTQSPLFGPLAASLPQQKRQNSMSAYQSNPSSKRTPNPLLVPLGLQSSSPLVPVLTSSNLAQNRFATPQFRRNVRKQAPSPNIVANMTMKTPTPSAYETPLSPGARRPSAPNNSDLTGSSPMDQTQPKCTDNELVALPASQQHQQQQQDIHQVQQPQPDPRDPSTSLATQRAMSDEEQQLATKLKETYKNIVNFEEIVQKSCIELTIKINQSNFAGHSSYTSSIYAQQQLQFSGSPSLQASAPVDTTELSNSLWTIYYHNVTLLNNYYDFLITALKPTTNTAQFKTGKNIVDLYKIPRRMWVYGIVGFLEVLKNIMSVFQEHEIFSCFIAYCFSIVSNLTDPSLEMEGWWCEKLGDLSRMAIALYASRFIDWKISAEYWYSVVMKTMYGHGKIYYHMCTVQQDNLDALVNIGKSVICRDPFVPTQQYLRLVVENICTQRNILSLLELPIIDFIKIHKVLLSIHSNASALTHNVDELGNQTENIYDAQIQYGVDLVTRYGITFGCDSHGYNFFTKSFCIPGGAPTKYGADPYDLYVKQQHEQEQQANTLNTIEKMNFWFNKGSLFAIANVNHLVGFGDPKNPFAKIFRLPEALKERKEKKERKRRSKSVSMQEEMPQNSQGAVSGINGSESPFLVAAELSITDWFYSLTYINKSVLKLSLRILNHYLIGPKQASTCHVIVWLYFLLAVGEAINNYPNSKHMFLWLFRKFFPWNSFINYLNALVSVAGNSKHLNNMCRDYLLKYPNYVDYFNQNEFLPEVWKCWGTLWFDVICPKRDFNDLESAGVLTENLFDLPICGTSPIININNSDDHSPRAKSKAASQQENNNDERLVRIILLARLLADKFEFGLVRTTEGFKFDEAIYSKTESDYLATSASPDMVNELFAFVHEVMYGDGRLTQDNFITPISPANLVNVQNLNSLSPEDKDNYWFHLRSNDDWNSNGQHDMREEIADDEEIEGYADSEFDDGSDYDQQMLPETEATDVPQMIEHRNPQSATSERVHQNYNDLYSESYVMNSDIIPFLSNSQVHIEGDLGDRMDSSLTYITLDTNIWLKHCGRIFKCVRNHIFKVLVPLIVFQELRSLRKSTEATIADAATRSVIIIRELYLAREIVPLRFDGSVASDINETTEFENNSNWMSNVDLTILNVVNEHDEACKRMLKGLNATINQKNAYVLDKKAARMFRYCILVTDDRNMRLRAKTSGLVSYQSKWLFGQLETIFSHRCID